MKSTGSSRSLTNGSSRSNTTASPLAASASLSRMSPSGKKTRRSSDKPPQHEQSFHTGYGAMDAGSATPEVMYQLPHPQLHHHHQPPIQAYPVAYGYAGAPPMTGYTPFIPPQAMMQRMPTGLVEDAAYRGYSPSVHVQTPLPSANPVGEDGGDLIDRIEKKDHMITQLGSFLSQMKQDSEGTAQAWKDKLHEVADLKRQLAALTQKLRESQDKEKVTAEQLNQVTEDVELAVQGLKEGEAKHLEELKILNDELQRRQRESEEERAGFDQLRHELEEQYASSQRTAEELSARCSLLEASLRQADDGHRLAIQQAEEQRREDRLRNEETEGKLQAMEKDKQELAQHLWNVTQALEQISGAERGLQAKLEEANHELQRVRTSMAEQHQQWQGEREDLLEFQRKFQSMIQTLEADVAEERSQKQEINAVMGAEMQRVAVEMQALHHQAASLQQTLDEERQLWSEQSQQLQTKLQTAETQYTAVREELDAWQQRASQIDAENQALQRNGSETNSTLQELSDQLRLVLGQLHTSQIQSEQLAHRCGILESGVQKCIQALPPSREEDKEGISGFPEGVLAALERSRQQLSNMEQLQLSLLQLQQDRDSERDKFRQREQELLQSTHSLRAEGEAARADASALAEELQTLTQRLGGSEVKLQTQLQQLTRELEDVKGSGAMQILQLQKSVETARQRVQQLESEKKELLHEAEALNTSMQALYSAKNDKQIELDQLRAMLSTLQLEHADLQERMEEAEGTFQQTLGQLNTKATELQATVHHLSSLNERLEREAAASGDALAKLKAEHEVLGRQLAGEQLKWAEAERSHQRMVEDKTQRMEEMLAMLTQLRARNESLEQARASEDQQTRGELDKCQHQLLLLTQDKKKLEVAFSQTKAQLDALLPELFTLKEKDRQAVQTQVELEEELRSARGDLARLQSECERLSRVRTTLQGDLNRATDDVQDALRQCEVLRRDAKLQHAQLAEEAERLRREGEELRAEASESGALAEELQTKLTSVQSAANATINELMHELQSAQDVHSLEKSRIQKELETWKSQASSVEEELRRKEADAKELNARCQQERSLRSEHESEYGVKVARLSSAVEAKKLECERLSKELEGRSARLAECERRLAPLTHARDQLQSKCAELRQSLDTKTREAAEAESKGREDAARVIKDKRELETLYAAVREDYEALKIQSSSAQQQWLSVERTLKQSLERTKAELVKVTAEARAMAQRLESGQAQAHDNVAELVERLHAAEQQKEAAVHALQKEVNLERERRREAEAQRMELQRLLRARGAAERTPHEGGGATVAAVVEERSGGAASAVEPPPPTQDYRKFYANEPMTNAELANLPMTLIKAQMGLEFASSSPKKSPLKTALKPASVQRSSPSVKPLGDNNDEIPLLAFDKLAQNPEEEEAAASPSCDSAASSSRRTTTEKRSSLLEALSSRSSSDRYLTEIMDSMKPQRNSSSGSLGSNNKKKTATVKKKRPSVMPSSSAMVTAAYAVAPSLSPSPPKTKSNSKLLPRIQQ